MQGYTPGEQPAVGERVVKLNTNENPFEPSPKVMKAIQQVEPEMLRRYPSPTAERFRHAAAKVLGVTPDMILAGNGSDDILTIATRTDLPAGATFNAELRKIAPALRTELVNPEDPSPNFARLYAATCRGPLVR